MLLCDLSGDQPARRSQSREPGSPRCRRRARVRGC